MHRLAIILSAGLGLIGPPLAASPEEDATFIARAMVTDDTVEAIRDLLQPSIVRAYEDHLVDLGVRISDRDRLARMLPDSRDNAILEHSLQKIETLYLEAFTAEQLAEIAAFHRTDLGRKLLNASAPKPSAASSDPDNRFRGYSIYALDESDLADLLTPEEQEEFNAFYESDAGKTLEENAIELSQTSGFTIIGAMATALRTEPQIDLDSGLILEIIEADGIVTFPNRILRRDLIERLRNDLE